MTLRPSSFAAGATGGVFGYLLRLRFLVLDFAGILLLYAGFQATWLTLQDPLNPFDEGLLLTHAHLMLAGQVPHRDFYSTYPPGIYLLIGAAWKIFGTFGWLPRLIALAIHLATAILAGRLAGRIAGRRYSLLTCGLTLLWMSLLGPPPFAWIAAMAAALAAAELFLAALRRNRPLLFLCSGLALGAVACLRHDFFIYLCVTSAAAALVWLLQERFAPLPVFQRAAAWLGLGTIVPIVVVWLPLIAYAGVEQIAADLYFDQVKHAMPARRLPFPPFLEINSGARFGLPLPDILTKPFPAGAALALAAPGAAAALLVACRQLQPSHRAAVGVTGVLAVAALPQMLGRTDIFHVVYVIPPALILWVALAEMATRCRTRQIAGATLAFAVLLLMIFPIRKSIPRPSRWPSPGWCVGPDARFCGLGLKDGQRQTVEFIQRNTRAGETIFSGNDQHQRLVVNDVSLYYLSDRTGATRYLVFDPNIVTRLDVQRQMTAELGKRVRVAVLMNGGYFDEPNESRNVGASWLDEYLGANFEIVGTAESYTWLRRKENP